MFVEIVFGSRFESIDAMPQENLIRIKRKDLRLCEATLNLNGEHDFMNLSLQMAFW